MRQPSSGKGSAKWLACAGLAEGVYGKTVSVFRLHVINNDLAEVPESRTEERARVTLDSIGLPAGRASRITDPSRAGDVHIPFLTGSSGPVPAKPPTRDGQTPVSRASAWAGN